MIGSTLSHYEITAELGRGGMGIVYKAHDTKLDREVAIKVLPSAALASTDDRERFYREAKSAAALHHPNIASVFEIDEAILKDAAGNEINASDGPRPFIAMEYIAGGMLQDKIKEAPLSLSDAVKVASQVAEALKAAHAKNIVHRDIKSANVMITEDGVAKVLDFGLAKTNQSTMLTRMGSTLGTVAYMSPEQARGQEVDGRSDLYSLGTVLYEMIAGRLPFAGEYEQAVVYSILNEPPEPLTAIRTGVPMDLERIVNKLLSKDADYRYQTATDLLVDLKSLDVSGSGMSRRSMPAMSAAAIPGQRDAAPSSRMPAWGWGLVIGVLLLGSAGAWVAKPAPEILPEAIVSFPLELESRLDRVGRRSVTISPDGKFIAYVTGEGIRLRRTDDLGSFSTLLSVEGTNSSMREVFFSPDSRSLAFEDDQNKRLMKVELAGGSPSRIAGLKGSVFGSSWAANGDIYLGLGDLGIGRISRGTGAVETLIGPDSLGTMYVQPSLLPDGHSVLYGAYGSVNSPLNQDGELRLFDLDSKTTTVVYRGATYAQYALSGHLLFVLDNTLHALPFDVEKLEWAEHAVPMVESVREGFFGNAQFYVSDNGTLVAASGTETGDDSESLLSWVSPDGTIEPASHEAKSWGWPDVSRDGSRIVAEDTPADRTWDLWTIEVATGKTVRLTSNGRSTNGVWSPDGLSIAHADFSGYVLQRFVENVSLVDTLLREFGRPTSWSSDGKFLFFEGEEAAGRVLKVLDVESGSTRRFPDVQDGERDGNISPDGRWLAYENSSAGTGGRVFVMPFPTGGDPHLVSTGFGINPRWSADGKRLYYQGSRGTYVTAFDPNTGVAQTPERVASSRLFLGGADYAVHPDGRLLIPTLIVDESEESTEQRWDALRIVIHFDDDLRQRASTKR